MKEFMENIINSLNSNSGAITVLLVILTGFYVYLTWRLLKVNNKPEIVIRLLPHGVHINWAMLSVENIGTGPARDVQFETDLSFKPDGKTPLEKFGALREGIRYFPRGVKIHYFLVSVMGKLDELKKTPFKITVTYKDPTKLKRRKENFCLDFGELEGSSREGSPLFEIAKAIQDVKEVLSAFTTKPIVLTESLSEHDRRRRTVHLEDRIINLSGKARTEIIEEIETLITKKEQEVRTERQSQKTAMDIATNRNKGQHELQEKWGTRPDATDESTNHDENI